MTKDRFVICAGCMERFPSSTTSIYRKKRCCNKDSCYEQIDKKVTNSNYKKQQRKKKNGKYRHGVPLDLKSLIQIRDNKICRLCLQNIDQYKMQVHHIIPVSEGGSDESINLILLCKSCHSEVHKKGHKEFCSEFTRYTESLEKV